MPSLTLRPNYLPLYLRNSAEFQQMVQELLKNKVPGLDYVVWGKTKYRHGKVYFVNMYDGDHPVINIDSHAPWRDSILVEDRPDMLQLLTDAYWKLYPTGDWSALIVMYKTSEGLWFAHFAQHLPQGG